MSETAHDLRVPLESVGNAIRLVHDGDMGVINVAQRTCLEAALDHCACMDQMIGEMIQLERLRTGSPRANRSWIEIGQVRRDVDESLRAWALPRNIDLLWDLGADPTEAVFADASMLRRLIVNLATSAIRASDEGGCVLIRLTKSHNQEMANWTIIDQGAGISEHDIERLADRSGPAAIDESLNLSICRQLAAVHFTSIAIRSRLGVGTEIGFETPVLGPRSVANAWSRWRITSRGPTHKPSRRLAANSADRLSKDDQRVRLDPPSVAIELKLETSKPRCDDRLAAGTVSLGAAVSREAADRFDKLLQSQLQMFELVYRSETRRWVWIFDADVHTIADRIAMITDSANADIGGVRMAWSAPQLIPIDARRTAARLSDLMVRESLSASTSSRVHDQDEVRLGSSPMVHSQAAAVRLDTELRRLSEQMRGQSTRLRRQATNLRPLS